MSGIRRPGLHRQPRYVWLPRTLGSLALGDPAAWCSDTTARVARPHGYAGESGTTAGESPQVIAQRCRSLPWMRTVTPVSVHTSMYTPLGSRSRRDGSANGASIA